MKKIAICDSGIGGLSVLKKIAHLYSLNKFIYLCDEINMPYGEKSEEQIKNYCKNFLNIAKENKADLLIVACNTMSVIGKEIFESEEEIQAYLFFPPVTNLNKKELCESALLCTVATAKSAPIRRLSNICSSFVWEQPTLAKEIEENIFNLDNVSLDFFKNRPKNIKKLFLGCTHYIHLENRIKQYFPTAEIVTGMDELLNYLNLIKLQKNTRSNNGQIEFIGNGCEHARRVFLYLDGQENETE